MDKKQTEALRIATESLPMLKIAASLGDETGQISFHSSHLLNLIEGYNAARQEIASLTARLATVSVGGEGSLVSVPPECPHLIWYADQDRKPEMFVGHGARDTAMKRFHMISQHWNANLFVRIKKSSRDCPYPVADLAPAPAQAMPAPGVEAVSEREFKQFLSDVITAAGLVTHGKKCKDLGRRLGEMSMRLLTAPQPAAARVATDSDDALMAREMYESQDDSLLLCASDLQHSAIYDNHSEMQSCLRAVADRITALASVIEGVERAAQAAPVDASIRVCT